MPLTTATKAARLSVAPMLDGGDLSYISELSGGVCSVCSCFDRALSCGVVFSSVRHVRNGETQFSNFICRNVSEMRGVRWDFRPSTRSVFLAGIAWVQSWRASPAITKRLSG